MSIFAYITVFWPFFSCLLSTYSTPHSHVALFWRFEVEVEVNLAQAPAWRRSNPLSAFLIPSSVVSFIFPNEFVQGGLIPRALIPPAYAWSAIRLLDVVEEEWICRNRPNAFSSLFLILKYSTSLLVLFRNLPVCSCLAKCSFAPVWSPISAIKISLLLLGSPFPPILLGSISSFCRNWLLLRLFLSLSSTYYYSWVDRRSGLFAFSPSKLIRRPAEVGLLELVTIFSFSMSLLSLFFFSRHSRLKTAPWWSLCFSFLHFSTVGEPRFPLFPKPFSPSLR